MIIVKIIYIYIYIQNFLCFIQGRRDPFQSLVFCCAFVRNNGITISKPNVDIIVKSKKT